MTPDEKERWNYSNKLLTFLWGVPPGWTKKIIELTNDAEKFISVVKELIDEGALKDVWFSNDYLKIYKEK